MRARAVVALLQLLIAAPVIAFEQSDLRGLDVEVEPIPEAVHIDGVASHLTHARGRDVPRLALRTERRWRAGAQPVQRLQHSGWTLLTRLRDGHSEVMQWKGEGADAQLIFSRIDLKARPRPVEAAPFLLPSACSWGRVVGGAVAAGQFEQRSARCRASAVRAASWLRATLTSQGWQVSGPDSALSASRDPHRASLLVLPGLVQGESWLVWVNASPLQGVAK